MQKITETDIIRDKYKDYSAEELIQDEYFIRSMANPTKNTDAFWREQIKEGILSSESYQLACQIFDSLQIRSETILNEEIDFLWDKINIANNKYKQNKRNHFFLWSISSVAALFFLFIVAVELIFSSSNESASYMIENIAKPVEQANDIQLILAGNEAIALDGKEVDIVYNNENIAINNNTTLEKQTRINESIAYNQLIVPKGKRSTLTFEDGSRIWINAGSRVVYPVVFADSEREIYIDGEVFLDVSHDGNRPFIVKSKYFNVEVLGTSFNFMAYESDKTQHVVLVSGSIKVKSKNETETTLSPNEMIVFENNISHIQKVNVNNYILWKSGMYQYQSERLDIILKRLSRYYGKEIKCDSEAGNLKCSGKLDLKDDIYMVLNGISQTAPVHCQLENDIYMIANK